MPRNRKSRIALWVRILLLIPLPVIAAIIYSVGKNPRPGLFEADLAAQDLATLAAAHRLNLPAYLPRSEHALVDTIQVYDESNLYEKINGHDVAFFRFGFVALTFASYSNDGSAFVDVYAYRMNRRENALGIFANERSEPREDLDLCEAAYRAGGALFFYGGPWYLQIIPSETNPETEGAVAEISDSLCALLPVPPQPLPQLSWFPKDRLITNSQGYLPDRAFGTDFIGDVFTAEYESAGTRVKAFRHTSDSAASIYSRCVDFLNQAVSPAGILPADGYDIHRFSAYGEQTWIASLGDSFIGLEGVTDSSFAKTLFDSLVLIARQGNEEEIGP